MGPINSTKNGVEPVNNNKNKLNSKISLQKFFLPKKHIME